jgi:tRNA(Ile)-lysidine synthase TilS/MesJ
MFTVFFPENRFGLFVSGGFDSALMLYLYAIEAKNRKINQLNGVN